MGPKERNAEILARAALYGVGDPAHEWVERTGWAVHIRRRLSVAEHQHVGQPVDCRNTDEWLRRFTAISHQLPDAARVMALRERFK